MRKDWFLTKEVFEAFLTWLSPDRDEAAVKYEQLHRKLIAFFEFKGCEIAEILTDEAFNRVSERLVRAQTTGEVFPLQFLYGTARIVYLEYAAAPQQFPLDELPNIPVSESQDSSYYDADESGCMKLCLDKLGNGEKVMLIDYFDIAAKAKATEREKLCQKYGETINSLRVKISRIRQKMQKCQKNCLNRKK